MTVSSLFFWNWVMAVFLSIWAIRIAQRFAMRLPRIAAVRPQARGDRLARVAVVVPIKGIEDDTAINVQALLAQDYPAYRLIFAVESEEDPVLALLEKLAPGDPRVEVVISGRATVRGQKIHNQLAAIDRTGVEDEVIAFMDADARPNPQWLRSLVLPLARPDLGATTGYRYYVPAGESSANKILTVLNAQVAALFGPYRRTFAWGGSMAIRRADFYAFGIHDAWQHALSDDYVFSYCVKTKAKSKIHFVPTCLVASEANFTWGSFFEFATRQYRITRVCAPGVWLTAVGGAAVYLTAFCSTLFVATAGWVPAMDIPLAERLTQTAMFVGLYGLSIARGLLLVRGGESLLPAHKEAIGSAARWATFGLPACYFFNLCALLAAGVGRRIVWRGIPYRMISRTQTKVERAALPVAAPMQEVASGK